MCFCYLIESNEQWHIIAKIVFVFVCFDFWIKKYLKITMKLERNIARHPLFQVTKVWIFYFYFKFLRFFIRDMQQSVCVCIHFVFLGFYYIPSPLPPLEIREGGDTSGCIKHAVNPVVYIQFYVYFYVCQVTRTLRRSTSRRVQIWFMYHFFFFFLNNELKKSCVKNSYLRSLMSLILMISFVEREIITCSF